MPLSLLTEVECNLKKMPKLDYGTPKVPAKPQPVWLRRQIGAIATGRTNLESAKQKLATLKTVFASEGTHSAEVDVACQEIRVKSAEARLDFSITKWKMLIAKVKEVYDPVTKAHKDAMALGSKMAGDAQNHLDNHDKEGAILPPIPDVKFDHKKGLVTMAGEPFTVPDSDAEDPEEIAVKPVMDPNPPAGVKDYDWQKELANAVVKPAPKVSGAMKDKLKAKIKAKFLSGGLHAGTQLGGIMTELGLDLDDKDVLQVVGAVYSDVEESLTVDTASMSTDQLSKLGAIAAEVAQTGGAPSVMALALQSLMLTKHGFQPDPGSAMDAVNAAKDAFAKQKKDVHQLTPMESAQAISLAKKSAIKAAMAVGGLAIPAVTKGAVEQALKKFNLSAAAIGTFSANAHLTLNQDWDSLSPSVHALVKASAQDAVDSGQSVASAVGALGIVGLSQAGLAALEKEVGADADPEGFKKAILEVFEKSPISTKIPLEWGNVLDVYNKLGGPGFVGLMSHHHVAKGGLDLHIKDEIVVLLMDLAKKRADKAGFKAKLFAEWDKLPEDEWKLKIKQIAATKNYLEGGLYLLQAHYPEMIQLVYGVNKLQLLKNFYEEWFAAKEAEAAEKAEKLKNAAKTPEEEAEAEAAFWASTQHAAALALLSDPDIDPSNISPEGQAKIVAAAVTLGIPVSELAGIMMAQAVAQNSAPAAPAPAPAAPPVVPPPAVPVTKFKKIGKAKHLTDEQAKYLAAQCTDAVLSGTPFTAQGKAKKQLGGIAKGIATAFKAAYAPAGVTGIGLPLVVEILESAIQLAMTAPIGAEADLKAGYEALPSGATMGLSMTEVSKLNSIFNAVFVGKTWVGKKKKGGESAAFWFASDAQRDYFTSLLTKAQAHGAVAAPVAVMPVPTSAPVVPKSIVALFGMDEPQMLAYADPGVPDGAPARPDFDKWDDKGPSGSKGYHTKKWSSADEHGSVGGSTHQWMHKADSFGGVSIYAEVAAYRAQSLLGGGDVKCWAEHGPFNGVGFTSHFAEAQDLRNLEGSSGKVYPWKKSYATKKTMRDLQRYHVIGFLVDDKDDHGGNFTIDEKTGALTGIDRGQAGKFFDSSQTLEKDLKWSVPKGAGPQDSGKGLARDMLNAWAAGGAVDLSPISHPEFLNVLERAEKIPDSVWDKLWTPYADAAGGHLSKFSTKSKDKTKDGYLAGMQERRKGIRAQVEAVYTSLAATRAASLKAAGDSRPIKVIVDEVEEQIGLDKFRQIMKGEASVGVVDQAIASSAATAFKGDWDDPTLPATSKVPELEHLKAEGILGAEFAVPSDDIKDGRVELLAFKDGKSSRVNATFWLDRAARAQLQQRLGWNADGKTGGTAGSGGGPPPKPTPPAKGSFTPPNPPAGLKTAEALHKEFWESATISGYTPPGASKPLTKIEKYLDKWANGVPGSDGAKHLATAAVKAGEMSLSKNPLEKAAGLHYIAEIKRIGDLTGPSNFTWKDVNTVTGPKTITPFTPDAKTKAEAAKGLEKEQAGYDALVAAAKAEFESNEAEKKEAHKKALVTWEAKYLAHKAAAAAAGHLPAIKHSSYMVPDTTLQVKGTWTDPGKKVADSDVEWGGNYRNGGSGYTHYEIDAGDGIKVFYVPGATSGHRKQIGISGKTRIEFPKDWTRDQMQTGMQKVAAVLGIDLRPATGQEQELSYLRKMAWLRRLEGRGTVSGAIPEPAGTVQERIDFWHKQFAKTATKKSSGYEEGAIGFDPRHAPELDSTGRPKKDSNGKVVMQKGPGGKPVPNPAYRPIAEDIGGRIAHWRFDVSEEEMQHYEAEGKGYHHSSKMDGAGIAIMVKSGAALPQEQRASRGITADVGQSVDVDRQTGGSLEFYTNSSTDSSPSAGAMVVSPRLGGYTATYANLGPDAYGTKQVATGTGRGVEKRTATLHEWLMEAMSKIGSGENTMQGKIDLRKFLMHYRPSGSNGKVSMDSDTAKKAKAEAKASGEPLYFKKSGASWVKSTSATAKAVVLPNGDVVSPEVASARRSMADRGVTHIQGKKVSDVIR